MEGCFDFKEFEGTVIVAGERGFYRQVEFCHVLEEPDVAAWVKPGLLALSTGHPITDGETGRRWLRQLNSYGVVALAVALGRYLSVIPEEMMEEANQLGFPLMIVPWDTPFVQITAAVHRHLIDQQTQALTDMITLQQKITEAALLSPNISALLKDIQELTHREVALVHRQHNRPLLFPLPSMTELAISLDSRGATSVDPYMGRQIALVANLFMLREQVQLQLEWDARSRFISGFLTDNPVANAQTPGNDSYPWRLKAIHPYSVIVLTLPAATLPGTKRPNPAVNGLRRDAWELLSYGDPFFTMDDRHHLLVGVIDNQGRTLSHLAQMVERLLRQYPHSAGVVQDSIKLSQLAPTYRSLVKLMPFAQPGTVNVAEDMTYPLVIGGLSETAMAILLAGTWDRISQPKLKETLRVWIEEMGDGGCVAERLGIHRNTLRRRITQVEQQLGRKLTADLMVQLKIGDDWERAQGRGQKS